MTSDSPKQFDWTPDALARFWDYCSSRSHASEEYFSAQFGQAVVAFLIEQADLASQDVLDYGCGPGFLIQQLLDAGARVSGVDFSRESVDQANQRFGHHSGWVEARTIADFNVPWDDASFNLICCLETIEHVLDEQLSPLFQEIHRLLKPGGRVLLTTPNSEDLGRQAIYCPRCDHQFHRWQHVRRWTANDLQAVLAEEGFETIFCQGISFSAFQHRPPRAWKDLSPRIVLGALRSAVNRSLDRAFPRRFPGGREFRQRINSHGDLHLVAVASRPGP